MALLEQSSEFIRIRNKMSSNELLLIYFFMGCRTRENQYLCIVVAVAT